MVLDASALIALLRAEPGADRVAAVADRAVIGSVNLAEVVTKLIRDGVPAGAVRGLCDELELDVRPFDRELAHAAGALVGLTRQRGLSLGDRACLALARQLGVPVLTGDRAWATLDVAVEVQLIR